MHNTDEAVEAAGDDIARNGPFPSAQAMRADDELYHELGEVARRRVGQHRQGGGQHYWTFWTRRRARQRLIRGAIVVGALTALALLTLASFARSEEKTSAGSYSVAISPASSNLLLAKIGADGTVKIDWAAVDACVGNKQCVGQSYAQLMAAIRDGTWKPINSGDLK